ncbi:Manganese transporter SMF1 [Ceratocystis lukuohia]|uniref:Manganese transporter SMF1 n=2 Tax=Ceratocystis TaxID=5157 RepID=A0A0F8CVA1_CERFI|nr:Manganese transporter SMF1 [Ceratocystis platani]
MNRPSRTDEPYEGEGYNQSPNVLSNDLTTNADLGGIANARHLHGDASSGPGPAGGSSAAEAVSQLPGSLDSIVGPPGGPSAGLADEGEGGFGGGKDAAEGTGRGGHVSVTVRRRLGGDEEGDEAFPRASTTTIGESSVRLVPNGGDINGPPTRMQKVKAMAFKYASFIGPGFMISVAYIDPGNYATDVAAGASYRFQLLFIVLLSNIIAIFLQTLCIKLGTVTGLNLASACRAFLPLWLNYVLYVFAECAIIATDIAEVIGFAIGLNLLAPKVPLVVGCAISILDVMVTLMFYQPHGTIRGLRFFEMFIVSLVLGVVVCFCIQLSLIENTSVGDVFRGYLPSSALVESKGLYQACGILGATVMPHSLYLGSGIVQPRLRDYDERHGLLPKQLQARNIIDGSNNTDEASYIPSLQAVRHSLTTSSLELGLSLFTFALFVNSAILIVAGASLYNNPAAPDADIFGIHQLLSESVSSGAGTLFALALLLSGISAGIVCTIAGQMVSEGALNWRCAPWLRRLITRSISVTPSIVIAAAVGRDGLNSALNASQVALSIILPFVTAPLVYFTCCNKFMMVVPGARVRVRGDENGVRADGCVSMANEWYTAALASIIWVFIAVLNVANIVLMAKGVA